MSVAKDSVVLPEGLQPRLLDATEAAAYCNLSMGSFLEEVEAGTLPGPVPMRKIRRRLWDRREIDYRLDSRFMPVQQGGDRNERKAAWHQGRS